MFRGTGSRALLLSLALALALAVVWSGRGAQSGGASAAVSGRHAASNTNDPSSINNFNFSSSPHALHRSTPSPRARLPARPFT